MGERDTVHASCVLVGEDAVLVRGAAGAGKSTLCRQIVEAAGASGGFARLVSDDRTRIEAHHGRLLARAVSATAGLVETRGIGVHAVSHEPAGRVRLVVDLVNGEVPRMPDAAESSVHLLGVRISRLLAPQGRLLAETVLTRLRLIRNGDEDTLVTL